MMTLQHKFVESVPEVMEEGVLYVSIPYCTVMHLCVCGCGHEVITPISPADWGLKFDGKSISLSPSIGNWSFDCRSHYWIRNNCVKNAEDWIDEKIVHRRDHKEVELIEQHDVVTTLPSKLKYRLERLKSFFKF